MVPEKKKEKTYFEKHGDAHIYAKKIVEAHKIDSNDAYSKAVKAHAWGEDNLPDLDKLNDDKVQEKFINTIVEYHLQQIKGRHGLDPRNDNDKDILLNAYVGFTRDALRELVGRYGSGLDTDTYSSNARRILQRQIQPQLYQNAASHIRKEHLSDITDKLSVNGKKVKDLIKTDLTLEEARQLSINYWENDGSLSNKDFEQIVDKVKIKKAKKPEAK